jgi:4-hydroxybenzoate polyprenyltransferase
MKTDKINRPGKVVVGKTINRHKTVMIHGILCAAGILLGGYVTWMAGIPELVLAYMMVAGLLWLYSFTYKRQFLIGNIIAALFSALVPMTALLDIPPIYRAYGTFLLEQGANLNFAIFWILGVAVFAFLTILSHEIIKDAEAFEGDAAYGCRSLPVLMGDRYTKWSIVGVNVAIVVMLALAYQLFLRQLSGYFSFFYILFFLIIPIIFISWKAFKATTDSDYRRAGKWMIWVMLAGIAYSGILFLG